MSLEQSVYIMGKVQTMDSRYFKIFKLTSSQSYHSIISRYIKVILQLSSCNYSCQYNMCMAECLKIENVLGNTLEKWFNFEWGCHLKYHIRIFRNFRYIMHYRPSSISHILEYEFFCLGRLGRAGNKEKKWIWVFLSNFLGWFFQLFVGKKSFKFLLETL